MKYNEIKEVGLSNTIYDSIMKLDEQYCYYFFKHENVFIKTFPTKLFKKSKDIVLLDKLLKGQIKYIDNTDEEYNECIKLEYTNIEPGVFQEIIIQGWRETPNHIKYIQKK